MFGKKKNVQGEGGAEQIERPESQLRVMWDTLKKNRAAVAGLVVIIILLFLAAFGDLLAPWDPEYSNMSMSFIPPCADHWFGTDQLGRDIYSRILSGTKISLMVGISAVAYSLVIGTVLGSVAGYFGGRVDGFIMRCMDIMLSIPSILLAITLMAALGKGLDKAVIAIGTVSIPEYARIVRSSILSVKENDYVAAAKVIGNSDVGLFSVTFCQMWCLPSWSAPLWESPRRFWIPLLWDSSEWVFSLLWRSGAICWEGLEPISFPRPTL